MKAKRLQFIPLLGLFLSSLAIYSSAQVDTTTETLKGRVVVDNGKPDKSTRIWIFEAKSGKSYTAEQDSGGSFEISLPEGYYFVFIADFGFVPYAKEIWLEHGKPMSLTVKLEPDWANMQDIP